MVLAHNPSPDAGRALSEAGYAQARAQIERGSLSFALASRAFARAERARAYALYGWCRYVDDAIDGAPSRDEQLQRLERLRKELEDRGGGVPAPVEWLHWLGQASGLPSRFPRELLAGMEMDVRGVRYPDLAALELYCYRVAGVVGVMMCYAMGVSAAGALPHAVALGNAMQLTNIARDVAEDASLGRCYLPEDALEREGLSASDVVRGAWGDSERAPAVARVVATLLARANHLYDEGRLGLGYLSLRSALAVAIAARVYQAIGRQWLERGAASLGSRTVVSLPRKLICALWGVLDVAVGLPARLRKPWRSVALPLD